MTSPGPSRDSALESAPDSQEATQLLSWQPPTPPPRTPRPSGNDEAAHLLGWQVPTLPTTPPEIAEATQLVAWRPQRYVQELDRDRNRRGLIVVLAVSLLVATALVLTWWLTASWQTPGPAWR